jgi:hypothetical protein
VSIAKARKNTFGRDFIDVAPPERVDIASVTVAACESRPQATVPPTTIPRNHLA